MKTTAEMTERQRLAVEALEGARREGLKLTEYAKRRGLAIRELYNAIAALRRKGLVPEPTKRPQGEFVAVRVKAQSAPMGIAGSSTPLCRIVHSGYVVECLQWPPPSWLAALASGSADVAS